VWQALVEGLRPLRGASPLRVVEVGAGLGTMIERLLERSALGDADYTAIDASPALPERAAARLEAWAAARGAGWQRRAEDEWRIRTASGSMSVRWIVASLFDDLSLEPFDLVLAHAFLDLVDLDRALPRLAGILRPGGLLYASLNFDGMTVFLPELEAEADTAIVDAYHASMDARRDGPHPAGGSRTGRRLLTALPRLGFDVVAAGASDWIVLPRGGAYPGDEAFFLEMILDMVERSVGASGAVEEGRLSRWLEVRRRQVARGELVFLAHQVDVLARRAATR